MIVVRAGAGDASQEYSGDPSPRYPGDVTPRGPGDGCAWCRKLLPATPALHARFCSRKCRQAAFRLRRRGRTEAVEAQTGMVFAYADPPYPGRARKYYSKEASYGGEVDHRELIASLTAGGYAGWALSTAADALREVLPLCPPEARVCAWVKPIGAAPRTYGLHNTWEPLIVVPGRRLRVAHAVGVAQVLSDGAAAMLT